MIIYSLDVLLSQFWTSPLFHVLTVASWPAYRFLRRQLRWSSISISKNFPQFVVIYTVKGCEWSRSLSGILLLFLWSNRCWQFVGFAWREEKWEMSYSDSGRSRVGVACAEWWTHDNPARLRQTGKRRQEALCCTLWPPRWSHQHALNLKKITYWVALLDLLWQLCVWWPKHQDRPTWWGGSWHTVPVPASWTRDSSVQSSWIPQMWVFPVKSSKGEIRGWWTTTVKNRILYKELILPVKHPSAPSPSLSFSHHHGSCLGDF